MDNSNTSSTVPASTAQQRLATLTAHMTPTTGPMVSAFDAVPMAPADPLFGLMAAYKADAFEKKVDLGVGAYRDDNGKPWILPVVKKVSLTIPYTILATSHLI